jgi:hypothetical protein
MTTLNTPRCYLCYLAGIVALVGVAAPVSAQAVITAYADYAVDGTNGYVIVSMMDQSQNMGTAYHYDYFGGSTVSGPSGTYYASEPGLYHVVAVPNDPNVEETDWTVEGGASFMCSESGLMSAMYISFPISTFTFRHHYFYDYTNPDGWHYYQRYGDSYGRKCAALQVRTDSVFSPEMATNGFGIGTSSIYACIRVCTAGWIPPVIGPSGSEGSGVGQC